jgi:polysaccharide export outer membrane protein
MKSALRWKHRILVHLAPMSLILVVAAPAQENSFPHQNGSNSTFSSSSGNQNSKPGSLTNSGSLSAIPDDFPNLRLTSGVLLNVLVYDEPELTTNIRVDDQGNISLPLIGSVKAAGKTLTDLQVLIEDKYRSAEILKNPQVTLNVVQYVGANVIVIGEVQTPGRLQMLTPHSLPDVIGMAGGETNLAGDTIEVETQGKDGSRSHLYHYVRGEDNNQLHDVMVNPGDTVRVKRSGVVYVLGAVFRPGGYVMQEDGSLNVAEAVSLAQGTLMQAKIGGIRVIRRQSEGTLQEIPIPYKLIMDGKEMPLKLEAQDIVYVPVSKMKSVFTSGASIVGQTGSAAIYAAVR